MTYETNPICGKLFTDKTFSFPIRIYYEDTDAGGIVYYANYLKYAERTRTEFLRHLGLNQQEMLKKQGIGFVVHNCSVHYKTPAMLDDTLNMTCKITELKGASLKMEQKLYRQDTLICNLEITLVFLNLNNMRPIKIPPEISNLLQ